MEWLDCDEDFAIVLASMPGPDCTCVDTEVERTDCTQTNRRCLDGQCVECLEDRDCPAMGRPQCEGSNQINNRGRCNPDNTCTMVGVPTFCEYGCEEGECVPEPPCPTLDCPGTPGPPSCDGDVWVTPLLVPDPDNCEVCIEVDQRWLCGGNEVCDPDLGCLPGGCDPCPVFDPPAPV
ncbi:MAG: hypothetical protein JJU06_14130, partial [Ectothiorhodospiraceae bacterium]|nr:hypothetical protein [Ectothiorhodospiraceae bacterium]